MHSNGNLCFVFKFYLKCSGLVECLNDGQRLKGFLIGVLLGSRSEVWNRLGAVSGIFPLGIRYFSIQQLGYSQIFYEYQFERNIELRSSSYSAEDQLDAIVVYYERQRTWMMFRTIRNSCRSRLIAKQVFYVALHFHIEVNAIYSSIYWTIFGYSELYRIHKNATGGEFRNEGAAVQLCCASWNVYTGCVWYMRTTWE